MYFRSCFQLHFFRTADNIFPQVNFPIADEPRDLHLRARQQLIPQFFQLIPKKLYQ